MAGNPDPKPVSTRKQKPPRNRDDRLALEEARARFRSVVLALDRHLCQAHGALERCEGPLHVHHVVTQQQLRKLGLHDLLWDPANGMTVCDRAHSRHHSGMERIRLDRVPARCRSFVNRHALDAQISHYG